MAYSEHIYTKHLLIGSRQNLSTLEMNPIIEIIQFPIKQVSFNQSINQSINQLIKLYL